MTDDVVCEREFNTTVDGEIVPIRVQWMRPQADQNDWRCDYVIHWPRDAVRRSRAMGVDSTQALILAMYKASLDLEFGPHPVRWFDNEAGLGLPVVTDPRKPPEVR